jgi:hypothetical protein
MKTFFYIKGGSYILEVTCIDTMGRVLEMNESQQFHYQVCIQET